MPIVIFSDIKLWKVKSGVPLMDQKAAECLNLTSNLQAPTLTFKEYLAWLLEALKTHQEMLYQDSGNSITPQDTVALAANPNLQVILWQLS